MTPEKREQQRLAALAYANAVRTHRREVKERVARGELDADAVLLSVDTDPMIGGLPVADLLAAMPGCGQMRVIHYMRKTDIPTGKRLRQLTPRQRGRLLVVLRQHRAPGQLERVRRLREAS